MKAFFVTIPHSGEDVPEFCDWLQNLPEEILMCDVDRFIDQLYAHALKELNIFSITTKWHRYAADLNRLATDVDIDSVEGSVNKSGEFARGFHWVITTKGWRLMNQPMSLDKHQQLVELAYNPFHQQIESQYKKLFSNNKKVYQLDLHSMPSVGTSEHRDPGEHRSDIVISDCKGQSCDSDFLDLVIASYVKAGFKVGYNWPYFGGRLTEVYGRPKLGQQVVQIEMNRGLYMNEISKKIIPEKVPALQVKLKNALEMILQGL